MIDDKEKIAQLTNEVRKKEKKWKPWKDLSPEEMEELLGIADEYLDLIKKLGYSEKKHISLGILRARFVK